MDSSHIFSSEKYACRHHSFNDKCLYFASIIGWDLFISRRILNGGILPGRSFVERTYQRDKTSIMATNTRMMSAMVM